MFEIERDIREHYAQGVERDRHATWGRLEWVRTTQLLDRHLPEPPAVVLDVGGAEGVYALPLAKAGYAVHLVDPIAVHVEAARAASSRQSDTPLASVTLGDARDLSRFSDGSIDAVLMMGPLYHLIDANDRARALAEAHRVLRVGGRLLAVAISRYASTLDGLRSNAILDPTFDAIVADDLRTGVHRNPDIQNRPDWFTLAYFHHPDELAAEVTAAGFSDISLLAVEGPAVIDNETLSNAKSRAAVLRAIERVAGERALLGASPHLMAVANRPE